jgi:hypothetical protein
MIEAATVRWIGRAQAGKEEERVGRVSRPVRNGCAPSLRTFLAQVDFPHRGRWTRDKLCVCVCVCMSAFGEMSAFGDFKGFNAIFS